MGARDSVSHETAAADAQIHTWAERIEGLVRDGSITLIDRVLVLASTGSTQDAARQCASAPRSFDRPGPGVCVLAGVQTSGRGRLGRTWSDERGLGLAMTLAIDARRLGACGEHMLSLAVGVAASRACESAIGRRHALGLRWPNDIVERSKSARKVCGVLIERVTDGDGHLLLIGIGVNVFQNNADFPAELRGRAASLRMLAESRVYPTRLDVACAVLHEVERALGLDPEEVRRAWMKRDVLVGTRRTFIHNGKPVTGVVEGIDPSSSIQVRTNLGNAVLLPAQATALVHE